ncbi:DUF1127 domain-containing protein [Pseudoprimorskyibacter insulae]|uniref:YjiS-like domain-containing protein n=1 Tax=Pseudoprimorskyibacter insulae TaxID=1695997 RepID=A0A2R8AP86_9RHOB|nr:DUF1127 domain-containing protein [Pseudoprimorskyibacter insulae]SPF77878.1 hypothetical protein PRI8871_00465 [Pseudoprimorskyibacter insulae]
MAAIETSSTALAHRGLIARIMRAITEAHAAYAVWREAQNTRRELNMLTDDELADIGLTRYDIRFIGR